MASKLVPCDPGQDRFEAVVRSLVTGAIALTLAVLTAVTLGLVGSVLGWLLVLASIPVAAIPLIRWRSGRGERLPVGHLDEPWREALTVAAVAAERIGLSAADAPPGAVAEHLSVLHDTACRHVEALHVTAGTVAALTPPARSALLGDARATARRLTQLADAADGLRDAQRQHLGPDPIAGLIEATEHLSASLRSRDLRPSD